MKFEDTIMSGEQMSEQIQKKAKKWAVVNPAFIEDIANTIAQAQAEISFKAGYKQAKEEMNLQLKSLADLLTTHRKTARQEVVDWVEGQMLIAGYNMTTGEDIGMISLQAWKTKLKEWGL